MKVFSAIPSHPALNAVASVVLGCWTATVVLFVLSLVFAPEELTAANVASAYFGCFAWFILSTAVSGCALIVYGAPALWLLYRLHLAGPLPALIVGILPGAAFWLYAGESGRIFAYFFMGYGACIALVYCLLAYGPYRLGRFLLGNVRRPAESKSTSPVSFLADAPPDRHALSAAGPRPVGLRQPHHRG